MSERPDAVIVPTYEANPYQRRLADGLEHDGVSVALADLDGAVVPLLRAWWQADRPGTVHLHWLAPLYGTDRAIVAAALAIQSLLELVVLRLAGVGIVWTVHNRLNHDRRTPRVDLAFRMVAARIVHRLIVHCDAARSAVIEAYRLPDRRRSAVHVVAHGHYLGSYPDDLSRREARERLDIDEDRPVLVHFGQIRPYKNVPALIETFLGSDISTRATLVIAGRPRSTQMRQAVTRRADRSTAVRTALEFVPDEEVQVYMKAADAVVFPFRSILTSGSTILAMSFGRAVVLPDMGCPSAALAPAGGIRYDPDDPAGLRSALERVVDPAVDTAAMGERNRERVATYDWTDIGERTAEIYGMAGR